MARSTNHLDIFDDDMEVAREALEQATEASGGETNADLVRDGPDGGRDAVTSGDHRLGPEDRAGALPNDPIVEPTDAHIKLRVRQSTREAFDEFKTQLSSALGGTRLMDSNVGRALFDALLAEHSVRIVERARAEGLSFRRPRSSDAAAMAQFDACLESLIRGVIRERLT